MIIFAFYSEALSTSLMRLVTLISLIFLSGSGIVLPTGLL